MSPRQTGRMEAVLCAREALRRLDHGESLVLVHDDLVSRGEVTMSYASFTRWIRRFRADPSLLPDEAIRPAADRKPPAKPCDAGTGHRTAARAPGEPTWGSVGPKAEPFLRKPPGHKPDMKKLIGEDYEETY